MLFFFIFFRKPPVGLLFLRGSFHVSCPEQQDCPKGNHPFVSIYIYIISFLRGHSMPHSFEHQPDLGVWDRSEVPLEIFDFEKLEEAPRDGRFRTS